MLPRAAIHAMDLDIPSLLQTGLRHLQQGAVANASDVFSQILACDPDHPAALHYLGVAKMQAGDYRLAESYMERSIKAAPDTPEFHHNLAAVYRGLGRISAAEACYRQSIDLKPDYYEAYYNWSNIRSFRGDPFELSVLTSLLDKECVSANDRSFLHFAAGKILDDRGEYRAAFPHFAAGNEALNRSYPIEAHIDALNQIQSTFTNDTIQDRKLRHRDDAPEVVFLVGFPRSGTTLTEQVLSSHPDVYGAGELPLVGQLIQAMNHRTRDRTQRRYPGNLPFLADEELASLADAYENEIRKLANGSFSVVLDKMPNNYLHVGLLAVLFPQARVIDCRRNAMDTCLSCYFTRFTTGHEYTCDLNHLSACYQSYRGLMEYWHATAPLQMIVSQYEQLVSAPRETVTKLLNFCGLEWAVECQEFYRHTRTVETASSWQVRQPLHNQSVERWRRYGRIPTCDRTTTGWVELSRTTAFDAHFLWHCG